MEPCIERKFFGGSERVTFDEFARFVIQDEDEAMVIAARMLSGQDPYPWNEGVEPEFYEEFSVIDAEALRGEVGRDAH